MKRTSLLAAIALLSVSTIAAAEAPTQGGPAPLPDSKRIGIGYKMGNGIGFLGGDVLINVVDHVGVDLQAAYFSASTSTGETGMGYAFAPAIHGELYAGQRSTPYAAVGLQYASLTIANATGSGYGGFANLGYEWKWDSGFGIQLGGGVQYLQKMEASSGNVMLVTGGKVNPNIEFGLRYMFL